MLRRAVLAGVLLALALAGRAPAAGVLVLGPDGTRTQRVAGLPPADPSPPTAGRPAAPRAHAAATSTRRALRALLSAGAIDPAAYDAAVLSYSRAQETLVGLRGIRHRELRAVLATVDAIAARGQLTAARLAPVVLTLDRNRQWWLCAPVVGRGQRVRFTGSPLLWQAYPGEGVQIQWLGTFGLANALDAARKDADLLALLDQAVALATPRAGGIAWESLFAFGAGRPPWVSGLTEGTAIQALARAGTRLHRPDLVAAAHRALGIFRTPPPAGVRVPTAAGAHYLQYSFAPGVRVLNGFVQSLNGLLDLASLTGDRDARTLAAAGVAEARVEVPRSDTGSWSLYDGHHESTVDYHKLLRQFLVGLCARTGDRSFCRTADRFLGYLRRRQAAAGPQGDRTTVAAPRPPLAPQAGCRAHA